MTNQDFPVFTLVGGNIKIVEFGIYTNNSSNPTTWNIPSPDQTVNVEKPLHFFCVNRGSASVTITPFAGANFIINGVSTSTFSLRTGMSAFIFWDGFFFYAMFAQEASLIQRVTPTTGTTVTINQRYAPIQNILLIPAGTLASLTLTFPLTPFDGQTIKFTSIQTITALTLNGNGATISGAITTINSNGFAEYVYSSTDTTWYRIG